MEDFLIEEVGKLIKEYNKTKDPMVFNELKQFVDHIENILK
jgi:hypothetical protein